MRRDSGRDDLAKAAASDLREAMMTAFCSLLHAGHFHPMVGATLMAEAVGSIYKEIADAHLDDATSPCGWVPHPEEDVGSLQAALALTACESDAVGLRQAPVAGHA